MSEVTRILSAIEEGDPHAAEQLLPLVYDELRKLAAHKLAHEKPGQTLDPTGLVHEAYLRLVVSPGRQSGEAQQHWAGRGHFFAAAAEAMRRILIDQARRKQRQRHGGGRQRVDLHEGFAAPQAPPENLLALDDALDRLQQADSTAAQLVKLRYFAGLTMEQAAAALGLSLRAAERNWTYARTWLHRELS
jgi:RNA polymerase sigma factor (TIGR02999 family)